MHVAQPATCVLQLQQFAEIERIRSDEDFTTRAKKLLERDREILDRLAK